MRADGSTIQSFKKLMTSAPKAGMTRASLTERRALKLKSMQNIINAMGANSFNSCLCIGHKASFICDKENIAFHGEKIKMP